MGISGGPDMIQDGLVLALDASDRNSYPGSGTAWIDMSGNNFTGTLTNGPTFNSANGGSIVLDGTNDFVNLGTILNYTSENFTFSYWVYFNSFTTNQVNQGPIVIWKGNFQNSGYYDQINSSGSISFITNQSGVFQGSSTANIVQLQQWCNICYVRSGSSVRVYFNGIDSTTSAATHVNPSTAPSNNFNIGVYSNNFIYGNFRIASLINYNRALSASEVLQNYNALKSRFNL